MVSSRARLDIATDNLANASSDGFRKHVAHGFLTPSGARVEPLASETQGALRQTGRALDLAIAGAGHFTVVNPDGTLAQTRDGSFARDRFGTLRDTAGRKLLGDHGVVHVPDGAVIGEDGAISRNGSALNRIPLPPGSSVQSGFLESANVNAIGEMVDMLSAQRSFESAQKVMTAIDSTHQKASNDLARLK